jgi:hypothetical protein
MNHSVIAPAMFHQFVEAVVLGVGAALRGDHVEGDAAVCDVVERVEQARHVVRVHEGGRIGEAKAEMAGDARHRGDPWAHVEAGPGDAAADGGLDRALVCIGDAGAVAEEDEVEQSALGDAGDVLEQADIRVVPAHAGAGGPPGGLDHGPGHVDRQMHLLCHGRVGSPAGLAPVSPCNARAGLRARVHRGVNQMYGRSGRPDRRFAKNLPEAW